MTKQKHYPLVPGKEHPHNDTVTISRMEYDTLREIARLHEMLLNRVEKVLPEVRADFKKLTGK